MKRMKINGTTLKQTKGKLHIDDVVSKKRIWLQIFQKSIDSLKKVFSEEKKIKLITKV